MKTTLLAVAALGCAAVPVPLAAQDEGRDTAAEVTSAAGDRVVRQAFHDALRTTQRAPGAGRAAPAGSTFVSTNDDPEGDLPRQLAFYGDGSKVAICNRDTDNVTVLDLATRSIAGTVAVGDFPVDVAVTPDSTKIVAPCVFSDDVYVIDAATLSVLGAVPVTGREPYRVAVTSDSRFAVVGVVNDATNSSFSVIDLQTRTEVRSFPSTPQGVFGGFATPETGAFGNIFTQFALAPDDRTIVLPDRFNARVSLYDLTTGQNLATLATAALPTAVDVSRDGTRAVVSHEGNNRTVTVLDLTTSSVSGSVATTADLFSQVVRITPDNRFAIVAVLNAVQFVDLATGASRQISTGSVGDIEISFDGQFAFVSNFNARIIDIASQTLVRTVSFAPCAEAAASPNAHRMAALNNRFKENVHLYDTNGAASALLAAVATGVPPESDAPRTLALAPDGETLVVGNNISGNATIVDLRTRTARAYLDTGERVTGLAVTPDGTHAVVCNTDSSTVSVIDLATDQVVASLSTPTRPAEVAIAKDSSMAYVTSVAGTDRLWFISLNGSQSAVVGSLVTGQMGSIIYTYNVLSGIALSPDGSTLAVCISFDDELMLVDTASRTEVARLPVGDFPIRAVFSADGTKCWVAHSFSDDVYEINVSGGSSTVGRVTGGIDFPLPMALDQSGPYLYVGSFGFQAPQLVAIDRTTMGVVRRIVLPSRPRSLHYSAFTDTLYLNLTDGDLMRLRASGPTTSVIDTTPLTASPSDLVFSEFLRVAVAAQPGAMDGFDVADFPDECPGTITAYGTGCPGSGGFTPTLAMRGCAAELGTLEIAIDDGLGGAAAALAFGAQRANVPIAGACSLLVGPLPPVVVPFVLPGAGAGNGDFAVRVALPPGFSGTLLTLQAFVADAGSPVLLAATGGVELSVP